MKRLVNIFLILVMLGAGLFVAIKAGLIPNPLNRDPGQPEGTPTPKLIARDTLRVAVAKRPERLMMSSLQRLLQVENQKLEVVDYNPQTVWLELAAGEIDLVVAPLGEAVKAQGRFKPGRLLMFTGESVGLDKLLARAEGSQAEKVAVLEGASTDFLARKMLPEATVIPGQSPKELESWLRAGVVDAALLDESINSPGLDQEFSVLDVTTQEDPMPTVAVLSRTFAINAQEKEYTARRDVLAAALSKWNGLVGYLDTQPELLKTTLKEEAVELGIDIDRLLAGYTFLTPARGRAALLGFQESGKLKSNLDLLVLAGVTNLTAPDWDSVLESPAFLDPSWLLGAGQEPLVVPSATPTPEISSSPAITPVPSPESTSASVNPTYHSPDAVMTEPWPEPTLDRTVRELSSLPPALSPKAVMVATQKAMVVRSWEDKRETNVPLDSQPTCAPISDGRNFFCGVENRIIGLTPAGKQIWSVEVAGKPISATTVIRDKLLYAVESEDGTGRLLCLDPLDGEILWEQKLDSAPASAPVVGISAGGPVIIVPLSSGVVKALDLANGTSMWTRTLSEPTFLGAAASHGKWAVTYPSGKVGLFSADDGSPLWETELGSAQSAPPTLTTNGVLVPSKDTYLYHLDQKDGTINWKTRISQPLSEPAVVLADEIVLSDEGGKVHTLQSNDGSLVSTVAVGKGWTSRVIFSENIWALTDAGGKYKVYGAP